MPAARPLVLALALVVTLAAAALLALTFARAEQSALVPTPSPAPSAAPPTSTATPAATATPAPLLTRPAATPTPTAALDVRVAADGGQLIFALRGIAPDGADQALLWLDTAAGREVLRVPLERDATAPHSDAISVTVSLSATQVITVGDVGPDGGLDYWVAVPGADAPLRRSGALALPPEIAALGQGAPLTPTLAVTWTERLTPHFRLYAQPRSDGERDLERLAEVAEAGYVQASALISPTAPLSVSVYLTPRVFWQGGVAYGRDGPLIISYLDRNYAAVETWSYFVHEVTHAIGAALLPEGAEVGGVLGEGLAVVATGGHYSREPIDARAATLATSGDYIPLCRLRYDFYGAQHETAYIQSASFVQHLIRAYGREVFLELYRAQQGQRGGREQSVEQFCAEDDARVAGPLGKTNGELEREWLAALGAVRPTADERRAWELTVRLYDTMRRYQELLDPPARVLPPPPRDWTNDDAFRALVPATGSRAAALETVLIAASDALRDGDAPRATELLDSVDATLGAGGEPAAGPAADHLAIAELLEAQARAVRLGDQAALADTLVDEALAARMPFGPTELLHDLRLVPVRLNVRGEAAEAVVEVTGRGLDGRVVEGALYSARFVREDGAWRLAAWEAYTPEIAMPPGAPLP